MNKTILIGRLTKKPEIKEVGENKLKRAVAFLAVPRYKDQTDFINLIFWDKKAEIAEKYLDKGSKIMVEGQLHIDTFEDKEKRQLKVASVIVDNIEFLDTKTKEEPAQETTDDLPFN